MAGNSKTRTKEIIYDGDCLVCRTAVDKTRNRLNDSNIVYKQSKDYRNNTGQSNINRESFKKSIVYIEGNNVYTGANAIIMILKSMNGAHKILGYIISIPMIKQSVGLAYKIFGHHRYKFSRLLSDNRPRRDP